MFLSVWLSAWPASPRAAFSAGGGRGSPPMDSMTHRRSHSIALWARVGRLAGGSSGGKAATGTGSTPAPAAGAAPLPAAAPSATPPPGAGASAPPAAAAAAAATTTGASPGTAAGATLGTAAGTTAGTAGAAVAPAVEAGAEGTAPPLRLLPAPLLLLPPPASAKRGRLRFPMVRRAGDVRGRDSSAVEQRVGLP